MKEKLLNLINDKIEECCQKATMATLNKEEHKLPYFAGKMDGFRSAKKLIVDEMSPEE